MITAPGTVSSITFGSGYQLELIIAVIIIFGIFRGLSGRRYTRLRVLRTPVLYLVLTLIAIFLTSLPNIYAQLMILLLPVGIPLGVRFGKDVKFFSKDGVLYYKRSPTILLLWAVALVARTSLELFSFNSLLAIIVFNALLSFITGMLVGEAIHILRTDKEDALEQNKVTTGFSGSG